jgi:hypothetical protein
VRIYVVADALSVLLAAVPAGLAALLATEESKRALLGLALGLLDRLCSLLVGLGCHLEHLRQALALVGTHHRLHVRHPLATLATLGGPGLTLCLLHVDIGFVGHLLHAQERFLL